MTTEIITDKFDVLRGRLLGNSAVQLCASYDSSCFVAAGLVVDLATYLPVEVVMISQESTTKDVNLVGYDFHGHTRGTLVVGIAYGCPYYKGSVIFSLVFFLSTTSEKSFIP